MKLPPFAAAALAGLLVFGILTDWVPSRWPLSLIQGGVFLLALAWLVGFVRDPQPVRTCWLLWPLAGALLWGLLQLTLYSTESRFETWEAVLSLLTALALFFLASQLLASAETRRAFRRFLAGFGFLLSIVSTLQLATSGGKVFWIFATQFRSDVAGPFLNRDHFASLMVLLLPLALWETLKEKRRPALWGVMAAVMFASVMAAASRAGALLVTAEVAWFLLPFAWRSRPADRPVRTVALRFALTAMLAITLAGGEVLWRRFRDPDPFGGRRQIWSAAWEMGRQRPGLGFGLGAWPLVYPAYATADFGTRMVVNHAHNDWLEWAAEGGLPFALLMLAPAVGSVWLALRTPWGLGVVAVFVHSLVDFPLQKPSLAYLLMVLLAAMAAAQPAKQAAVTSEARPARPMRCAVPLPAANL